MQRAVLKCRQLTFARGGGTPLLHRIEAEFGAQGPVLVTGETGAGKSTLLHLLGAMLHPTGGEIWADDRPVSRWPGFHRDLWRRQVGMVFQHLHLANDLTVTENIVLPCIPKESSWEKPARRAAVLLDRLNLSGKGSLRPYQLSGGQRQRIAWARAFIAEPRFVLLDEPTAFQDDGQIRILLNLLEESVERGCCVVVCSHDERLRSDRRFFTRAYRLAQGRLEILP
jgi:putative ABC transport system ATP-binding protein